MRLNGTISAEAAARPGTAWRADVIRFLDRRGPRRVGEIPRQWPLTDRHLRHIVVRLIEEGLVERVAVPETVDGPVVRLTADGRERARRLDRDDPAGLGA